jgi:alpha-galactosidase/6-phospho-beta-glucosidase family protein
MAILQIYSTTTAIVSYMVVSRLKISIIGAGSIIFTRKLIKDLLSYPDLRNVKISLMDIDSERLDITGKIVEELIIEAEVTLGLLRQTIWKALSKIGFCNQHCTDWWSGRHRD